MAGCLRCGEGNISPGTLRKWTEKLSNILLNPSAREKFNEFLLSRSFEQGHMLLEFWGKCDHFLNDAEKFARGLKQGSQKKNSRSSEHEQSQLNMLIEEAKFIVEFADSEINFDPAQMQTLYTAVQNGNIDQIIKVISDAKQTAAEMLEEEGYKEFCNLLKNQGSLEL